MKKNEIVISEFDEKVVELYIKGLDRDTIALELEVPKKEVDKVFKKSNIKQILEEAISNKEVMLKAKNLSILEKLIAEKIESGELLNENRDILDLIYATDKLTKENEKKRLGTSSGNIFIEIMNDLT